MGERRKPKGRGGFIVGMLAGVAAGVGAGSALLKRMEASADTERPPGGSPPNPVDQLKRRFRDALAEGRVAAAEREAELEEQLARERKRPTAIEVAPVPRDQQLPTTTP